jgi:hypothetical protein
VAEEGHNGHDTHLYSGKVEGTREFGLAFVVVKTMNKNVLDFKAVYKRICILRIKAKFHNQSCMNVHAATEGKVEMEEVTYHQKMKEA